MKVFSISLIALAIFSLSACQEKKVETGSTTAQDSVTLDPNLAPTDTLSSDSSDIILPTEPAQ